MKSIVLVLLLSIFSTMALARSVCGVDVTEFTVMEALGDQSLGAIARVTQNQTVTCEEGGRRYLVAKNLSTALYIDHPIIPVEIFTGQFPGPTSRAKFISALHRRAWVTVTSALASGLIKDAQVLSFLNEMNGRLFEAAALPIVNESPDAFCRQRNVIAYVEPNRKPIQMHLCLAGYDSESPHTVIHEYTHIIQFQRQFSQKNLGDECMADLVAMTATKAAAQVGALKTNLDIEGSYFQSNQCPTYKARYEKFVQSIGAN